MKDIKVNNNRTLTLNFIDSGLEVIAQDGKGNIDYTHTIPDKDIVMLINYWKNCTNGLEKSDYIKPRTDFANDEEKMRDFHILTKAEFLESYSYLTEKEYDATVIRLREENKI